MARILIENATKTYHGSGRGQESKTALDRVSLEIHDREFFSLLGPSGCGKTTLLRSVAGFFPIDSGRITIGDTVVADRDAGIAVPPEHRSLGMVFQSYAVWPHMTVFDNVAYPLRIKGFEPGDRVDRAGLALRQVRLDGLESRYPAELSGGQQQRVALARAIVMEPAALLLDEPLSNLDARLRAQMRFELKELQQRLGLTILYVTHDQEEALAMSDRIAVMDDGVVVQQDRPEDLYQSPATISVASFLGRTSILRGTLEFSNGSRTLRIAGHPVGGRLVFGRDTENQPAGGGSREVLASARYSAVRATESKADRIPARTRVSTFMGDYWLHELSLEDGQTIIARGDIQDGPHPHGSELSVEFTQVHVFPADAE
ncbi:MAG: ABC transporter ATP-binding protein [Spirochaetota bacterium]